MNLKGTDITFDLGDGQNITIETGKVARQADGSVIVRHGETVLLATVVSRKEAAVGFDYFPLSVEYREKFAAGGRIPGGFLKREGRPSDHEVLICRLVDRAIRPLFPENYKAETQVIIYLLSSDKETMPDALACLAASSALAVSDIPFGGPVSEVRVARIGDRMVINPAISDMENAEIDLIVAATQDNIMMVEGSMDEVSESDMLEAIKFAHEKIKIQCAKQLELASQIEKSKVKRSYDHVEEDPELEKAIRDFAYDKCYKIADSAINDKHERSEAFAAVKEAFIETLSEEDQQEKASMIGRYFKNTEKEAVRAMMLETGKRLDGRQPDEIRPITCEVDYLPGPHGTALFTRGETQSMTTVTLGTSLDEQIIDGAFFQGRNNFLLHYNFPPFCTGEVKRMFGTSRREVGHGNLAWRALKNMIPAAPDFPYTLRVVSDIMESNGSSSMATVCAGSLALMDAGVQTKKQVAGIAMGMIAEGDKFMILSDILGDEDHLGDMDFKVTGTADGITATQMDIKIDGLSYEILTKALEQARKGREHILGIMNECLDKPRPDYKPHAPRIVTITIPKDLIGTVIGPGGKVIQELQSSTGTTIIIEEKDDQGFVNIAAADKTAIDAALDKVRALTAMPEEGEVYNGKVKSIVPFGAFVEILPGKDGLLHISEIDWKRIEKVEDVLKEGQMIDVKLIAVDPKTGKLKLSRKQLLPRPERKPSPQHEDGADN